MKLSSPKIEKFRKGTFRVQKLKNFLYFWKQNFLTPSLKNSYIFFKKQISYISGGNFKLPSLKFLTFFVTFLKKS